MDSNRKDNTDDLETAGQTVVPTVTSAMKWWLALILGVLFFLLSFGGTLQFN